MRFKGLGRNPLLDTPTAEAHLYYRRGCLAATEERFDVALIFCAKALEIDARHLPTRLLVARIQDHGLANVDAAVAAYRKVIALSGYDGQNPFCAAAREALNALVQAESDPGPVRILDSTLTERAEAEPA